ncbi:type I-E CRISPR-associated protein Cas6/Cse3/CasE [Nocardia asteroides]|uniref:type I-E CRISPR-associated protein Cas6/Cse3/CasE n=1 Tax=Nocardia asteroides TaxID=1824 RepID=UPI001E4E5E96|nr:type I-E CRISPR-associated protein Cas6/Cse3/CasE [Nocardia asteroides]UGT59945.1 type I-E CRISPR-associated protein Cas6/Cse3/CasE [Nocardia asteroides]
MFLSRVPLNGARTGARRIFESPQVAHAAVLAAFPPQPDSGAGRVLWRIDRRDHQVDLYVVSPAEPDFTHIVEQAGWPTTTAWTTRKYTPLLDRLEAGQRWHFRLTANPIRAALDRSVDAPLERGKPTGLTHTDQIHWLQKRAAPNGFTLGASDSALDVVVSDRKTVRFRRRAATVTVSTATYEGTLAVVDADRLRYALTSGIGRAKAYGCGLLTLAPTQ